VSERGPAAELVEADAPPLSKRAGYRRLIIVPRYADRSWFRTVRSVTSMVTRSWATAGRGQREMIRSHALAFGQLGGRHVDVQADASGPPGPAAKPVRSHAERAPKAPSHESMSERRVVIRLEERARPKQPESRVIPASRVSNATISAGVRGRRSASGWRLSVVRDGLARSSLTSSLALLGQPITDCVPSFASGLLFKRCFASYKLSLHFFVSSLHSLCVSPGRR